MTWVLLHGFTGAPASWADVVEGIEQPTFTPPLYAHGDSLTADIADFEDEVTRLLCEVETLGAGPHRLCGYSMGARVALGMLLREPARFSSALLIGLHPGLAEEEARTVRRQEDGKRAKMLRDRGLAFFVERWEQEPIFTSQARLPESVRQRQRQIRLQHDAQGLSAALTILGLGNMPNYRARVSELLLPIELMAGADDEKFLTLGQELYSSMPNAQLTTVPGAGHNVLLENPEAVIAALQRHPQEYP